MNITGHLIPQTVPSMLLGSRLSSQTKLKLWVCVWCVCACVLISSRVCGSQKAQVNGIEPNPL